MSALLTARSLSKHFPRRRLGDERNAGTFAAVDDVDLDLAAGETLALIGESGSGKTTLGRCLLRLIEPTSGDLAFDGVDLLALAPRDLRRARRRFQMVFQDPLSSLDPRMRIGSALAEPVTAHGLARVSEVGEAVTRLLDRVGLPADAAERFPHEFSGGQRQRISIARALATEPDLIVADEPVSALDVSVRAQIVNLLAEIQAASGLALLFIAHDLALVEHFADRTAVMYGGRIVETAACSSFFRQPAHPYSVQLLASIPGSRMEGSGLRPSNIDPSSSPATFLGCGFRHRCPVATPVCAELRPDLVECAPGHRAACHFPGTISLRKPAAPVDRNFSVPPA